jgi:hypothetical protein
MAKKRPLTEAYWLQCTDSDRLLLFIAKQYSRRKGLLLASAFCRQVWCLFTDEHSRQAVELTERVADGLVKVTAWRQATLACFAAATEATNRREMTKAAVCSAAMALGGTKGDPRSTASLVLSAAKHEFNAAAFAALGQALADLTRDVMGNPFRPVSLHSAWQTANVLALAQAIYDDRAFDRMPILGDALEDAGCDNAEILNHCRQDGEHVRGCWVVDLVLEKE